MKLCLILILLTHRTLHCLVNTECIHAPDAESRKEQLRNEIFRSYLRGEWTYKLIDQYRKNTRPYRSKNLIDIEPKQTRISGKQNCKKSIDFSSTSDISEKATCPWHVVLDVDYQRQPLLISKAKCTCKRCFTVDRNRKSRNRCTEVNSYLPVIKWRCPIKIDGTGPNYFEYFVDLETVPVGCTCKRPVEV